MDEEEERSSAGLAYGLCDEEGRRGAGTTPAGCREGVWSEEEEEEEEEEVVQNQRFRVKAAVVVDTDTPGQDRESETEPSHGVSLSPLGSAVRDPGLS